MGAKTNITQADTMTPQQKALLNSMMTGSSNLMQGIQFGQGWGGPGSTSRQGYGGTPWNTQAPSAGGGDTGGRGDRDPRNGGGGKDPGGKLMASNPMAPIPSSSGYPATAPASPGMPAVNPWGMAAYSDRNQIVSPIVNPFRRNLGG